MEKFMAKCNDISKLKDLLIGLDYEKESQIGKDIFRKNGVVCSVFDNKTVLIQGVKNDGEIELICKQIEYINGGQNG
jgi:ribonuclease HIII